MAINKVVNKSTKSHGAMRNVIEYVLRDAKTKDGYVDIIGPYNYETINWDNVYRAFLEEKKLWNKDSGRMYAHNIISFHKDEQITPEQCLEIGREFADKFFDGHQCVVSVHQDKDHVHCHIVTNTVSYIDGMKLHQTKHDLEKQKEFTNSLCLERGLTITEKGKHFDGTAIEDGQITAWSKDKYNLLNNDSKKSYVVDCAIAVMEAREVSCSKEDFINEMEERGWHTTWSDSKKHITFQNDNGEKVRDSNLEKSFSMDVNKEVLLYEFERQNELRLAKLKADRDRIEQNEREQAELERYYTEVESAVSGKGTFGETVGSIEACDSTERQIDERGQTRRPEDDTEAFITDIRADISDNRTQNRAVRNTENKSISVAEQRRFEEQQRAEIEKAARRTRSKARSYSDFER